jgi:hypothetical protein
MRARALGLGLGLGSPALATQIDGLVSSAFVQNSPQPFPGCRRSYARRSFAHTYEPPAGTSPPFGAVRRAVGKRHRLRLPIRLSAIETGRGEPDFRVSFAHE